MFTKKTRVISAIATVCMVISMLACVVIPTYAADAFTADNTPKITAFTAETATAASAYVITSADDMVYAATIANNDKLVNTTVYLAADIDLSGKGDFIGFGAAKFDIDGQGHTISKWKNTTAGQVALVLRGATENIKNIKFIDCDLKASNHSALVYGSHSGDNVTGFGTLTISNIYVEDCDMTTSGGQSAFILANTQARATNINDIIVKNSTIAGTAAAGVNNLATVVGRMSGGKALTLTNIYIDGVTITGGADNVGIMLGKPDNVTSVTKNAVILNSSITAKLSAGVFGGRRGGGDPVMDNVLAYKPTITAETPYYVHGNLDWFTYGKNTNMYTSAVSFNYGLTDGNGSTTAKVPFQVITDDQYTSGEMAYTLSKNAIGKYTMFWEMDNGKMVPTNEAGATRKVTLELLNGTTVGTMYVDGGETATLSYAEIPDATFALKDGAATIDGTTLTMGTTGDVTIQVLEAGQSEADAKRATLKETIDYFDARNINYYVAEAAAALENAKSVYEANGTDVPAYEAANTTLEAFKTQMADTYPNVPSISEMDKYPAVKNYKIMSAEDLIAASGKAALKGKDITLHLGADINLEGKTFNGFSSYHCSINGQNHKIYNWTNKSCVGFLRYYEGASIKDITFDNVHLGGVYGRSIVVVDATGKTNITFDNVNVINSSTTVGNTQNLASIFYSHQNNSGQDKTVTIRNCSVINTDIINDIATNGDRTNSGIISGRASSGCAYVIENLYVNDFQNGMAAAEYTRGNGVLFGTVEGGLASISIDGAVIANCGGAGAVYDIVGRVYEDRAITIKDVVSANNSTAGFIFIGNNTPANTTYAKASFADIYTDHTVEIATAKTVVTGNVTELNPPVDHAGIHSVPNAYKSGAAAAYANVFMADGGFLFTTTADGMAVGNAGNATRKITLELGTGEVVGTYYANVGATVTVAYAEDDTATFEIKEGSTGSIANGNEVTVTANSDVIVVVGLGAAEELANAKAALQEAINYFKVDRNIGYFTDAVAISVAEAEALIATSNDTAVILAKADALKAAQKNYAITKENAPGYSEAALYPDAPLYVIRTAADFDIVEAKKNNFTVNDTIYLGSNVDMKGSSFNGIEAFKASIDGQGYKIQNWGIAADGTTKTNLETRGLFYNTYNGVAAVKSFKNITFENCHIVAKDTGSALVYGIGHANAGVPKDGSAAELTFDNIKIVDCSMTGKSGVKFENAAFLLARYGIKGGAATVNITNCSITGSTLDMSAVHRDGGHFGLLIGKVRSGNETGASAVYNVKDIYLYDNTVKTNIQFNTDLNRTQAYAGAIFGTTENSTIQVNLSNIGLVKNDIDFGQAPIGNLICTAQGTPIKVNGLVVAENTVKAAEGTPVHLFEGGSGINASKLYSDATVNSIASGNADLTAGTPNAAAAWAINNVDEFNMLWTMDAGKIRKGTADNATRKVEMELATGDSAGVYYVNVGATQALDYTEAEGEEFSVKSGPATITDGILTLNGNADVVVAVDLGAAQELQNAKDALQATINYYKVDRNINYFKATVAAAVADAEALVETSNDLQALIDAKLALEAMQNEYVEEYPNVPSVAEVDKYPTALNYTISSKAELEYLSANHAKFNRVGVTIHLAGDIDMTGTSTFTTLQNSKIALNGQNHKIYNWTHTFGSYGTAAIFSGNYQGGSVKNLTFENCNFAGGYSRAVLFAEYGGGSLTIDNVDMINVTLDANAAANQMGLYVSRTTTDVAGAEITIKNCLAKGCKLENSCNSTINNCGILAGCIKNKYDFTVENVDIFDCENNTETGAGGLAIGSIESSGITTVTNLGVFGGKITTATTAPYAGVVVGMITNPVQATFTNCVAMGVETTATQTWLNRSQHETVDNDTVVVNCVSDFGGAVKVTNNATGEHNAAKTHPDLEVTTTENIYEAAYLVDRYVSDAEGAYPSFEKRDGYADTFKVTFKDASDNNKVLGTFYTKADGKLPAAAADLLNATNYEWKLGEDDVTIDTVYTADAEVISNAQHNCTGTPEPIEGTNTHKVPCIDDGCDAYLVVDCAAATYVHKVVEGAHKHDVKCVCGRVLSTEDCDVSITAAEGDVHVEDCSICDYNANVPCEYTDWTHDETTYGASAKHIGTCDCGDTKIEACQFGAWTPVSDPELGKCGEEARECSVCGYDHVRKIAMLSNAEMVLSETTVMMGDKIYVDVKVDADTGLAGVQTEITFNANELTFVGGAMAAGTFGTIDISDVAIDGETATITIIAANGANLTGVQGIATLEFAPINSADKTGTFDIAATVTEASVIVDNVSLPIEVAGAEGAVTVNGFELGDANCDGKISIADAVMVLRVINGQLNADLINEQTANVVDDAATSGAVLTTADAIAILRMLLA